MNLRRPLRWWVRFLGATVAVTFLAWFCFELVWTDSVRLPDGREVSVRALTYGTNHIVVEGPFWARLVRRQVPKLIASGKVQVFHRTSLRPTCVVWTRWVWSGTNGPPRFASVVDRHGLEAEPIPSTVMSLKTNRKEGLVAWQWENFPRRQGRNLLRFYERDALYRPEFVGELRVQMPSGPLRQGNPSALPLRQTVGNIEFSLLKLRCGDSPPTSLRRDFRVIAPWTSALFSVSENGQPSSSWTLRRLRGDGETDNHFSLEQPEITRSEERINAVWDNVLWPDEASWRLVAEFARIRNYAAEELVTVKGLLASSTNPPLAMTLGLQTNGIVLQTIALRGTTRFRPYVRGAYIPNYELTVTYAPKLDRLWVDLVRVVDERGRELRFGDVQHPVRGMHNVALEVPFACQTIDVTWAVHRSEVVEFQARPTWNTQAFSSETLPR